MSDQASEAALALVPGTLLELVNQDLGGKLDEAGALALRSDPRRWLGVLYGTLRSVDGQIEARDSTVERELERESRGPGFDEKRKRHAAWKRRAVYFRRRVLDRISYVRELMPEDDLKALLLEGTAIDVNNSSAVRDWQERARRVLAVS